MKRLVFLLCLFVMCCGRGPATCIPRSSATTIEQPAQARVCQVQR